MAFLRQPCEEVPGEHISSQTPRLQPKPDSQCASGLCDGLPKTLAGTSSLNPCLKSAGKLMDTW